jgi:predicted transcriptional regulator
MWNPTSPLTRVLQLMVSLKMRSFPVMTPDRQLVGMISREDVMRAVKETTAELDSRSQRLVAHHLASVSNSHPFSRVVCFHRRAMV